MSKTKERRRDRRLHYQLPVRFAEDFDKTVSQGIVIDISNRGMAFSCSTGENCPYLGQQLTTRFSIPNTGTHDLSDMKSFTRTGRVCRVDDMADSQCRITILFDEPPPFWNIPQHL